MKGWHIWLVRYFHFFRCLYHDHGNDYADSVYFGMKGINRFNSHFLEHHKKLLIGLILVFLGLLALFENYGFKVYFKQEGFHYNLSEEMPERFLKIAEWVAKKPDYKFIHFQ